MVGRDETAARRRLTPMPELPGPEEVEAGSRRGWLTHLGRDVDPAALRASLSEGSLPEAFHRTAAAFPERPALEIDGEEITHGDLDARAARVAGWLRSGGVAPGHRVLLCGANSIAFVTAYVAILRAGAIAVPAGTELTRHELEGLVGDAAPAGMLVDESGLETLRDIAGMTASLPVVVSLGDGAGPSLARAVEAGPAIEPEVLRGGETAVLSYTSGTTGHPKGAPLSHSNLLSSIRAAMLAWRWSPNDTLVHALPFTHQHGLGGVHATLLSGSRAVIQSRFEPGRLAEAVARDRATVLFAVPAMYERLCAADLGPADFSSLRLAISGSAPLAPSLAERAGSLLGRLPVERYGTTESGLDVSNPYEGDRKPGSVGLPLPGVEVALVDEDGRPLPAGAQGEIVLRGPQVFSGYRHGTDDDRSAFLPGGWFRTGDVGCVDPEDGYLSITGRSKEVIITGGLNVYPLEVELALEDHPDVVASAVLGVPSHRWGEEVTALVVAVPGRAPDSQALIAHTRTRLAPYKCPKRVVLVDALPTDAMGKVARAELRRLLKEKG